MQYMPPQEREPAPSRVEARILTDLGYARYLDAPVLRPDGSKAVGEDGRVVTGRNFLDAYRNPDRRLHTEDLLEGHLSLDSTDPDYEKSREYIESFLLAYFGETKTGAG